MMKQNVNVKMKGLNLLEQENFKVVAIPNIQIENYKYDTVKQLVIYYSNIICYNWTFRRKSNLKF